MIFFILMVFMKVVLYFYSTRIAIINSMKTQTEKGYTKYYYNFLFLSAENKNDSYYSRHSTILNLIKDPFLALILVFFSEIPTL